MEDGEMKVRDCYGKVHDVISENETGFVTLDGFIHRTKGIALYWCRSMNRYVTVPKDND
jgi:hypothetical protein